jgi:hypothetical protein
MTHAASFAEPGFRQVGGEPASRPQDDGKAPDQPD